MGVRLALTALSDSSILKTAAATSVLRRVLYSAFVLPSDMALAFGSVQIFSCMATDVGSVVLFFAGVRKTAAKSTRPAHLYYAVKQVTTEKQWSAAHLCV